MHTVTWHLPLHLTYLEHISLVNQIWKWFHAIWLPYLQVQVAYLQIHLPMHLMVYDRSILQLAENQFSQPISAMQKPLHRFPVPWVTIFAALG